ncbi:uncharacterized protein METZ01_LOCUS493018, partial [marine metagenome]
MSAKSIKHLPLGICVGPGCRAWDSEQLIGKLK